MEGGFLERLRRPELALSDPAIDLLARGQVSTLTYKLTEAPLLLRDAPHSVGSALGKGNPSLPLFHERGSPLYGKSVQRSAVRRGGS